MQKTTAQTTRKQALKVLVLYHLYYEKYGVMQNSTLQYARHTVHFSLLQILNIVFEYLS